MNDTVHKQRGLTIVEALVTMVILMIVLGGVYQIFQSVTLTYRMQAGLSRVQENGRFALDFITRDVRQAGYRGCVSSGPLTNTLNNATDWAYDFNVGVFGYDDVGTSVSDLENLPTRAGSDVIVVRTMAGDSVQLVQNKESANLTVEVTSDEPKACDGAQRVSGLCEGDILLISDCVKSRVFQISSFQKIPAGLRIVHGVSGDPGNMPEYASWGGASAPDNERFGPDSEIMKVATLIYHVRDNFALYRKEGTAAAQPLVEGVETMQVLYGEDTDGDGIVNEYVVADEVGDWERVRSIQIGLLMRTMEEIRGMDPHTKPYDVLETEFGPYNDRHIRRVFTTTIGLRNRLK
ncbi:PilW family protein [Desulfonatronum sp. SC1]|uniref:PilW family protein n=1 Tax=Desulfonatronum sp. SC1 TaxID=2109626 RepID=UPI001304CE8E|nr:PilW family protein [Desulfonatronum sp. SC1]